MMFLALSSFIFLFHHVSCISVLDPRILNGFEVKPDENKHTVAITINGEFICGGSIIEKNLILNAAHCLIDEEDRFRKGLIQITAGSTDLTIDHPYRVQVDVKAIYAPMFYNGTLWKTGFPRGDIAVLKLRKSLRLRKCACKKSRRTNLEKLRLPELPQGNESYIHEVAVVTGYGLDKVETATMEDGQVVVTNASTSLKMYKANTIVLNHVECSDHYETMYDSNLCGKVVNYDDGRPQGVCEGDSGGPVVYGKNMVIGVVSGSAPACNENEYPSVFTRVASFLDFIQDVKRGRQLHMRVKLGKVGRFF